LFQEQQRRIPQYDTAAIVKLVAVRVLDDAGRPVMDLVKDDFVLTDNGRKMTITEFEVHLLDSESTAAVAAGVSGSSEIRGGLNRKIFIFLDLQSTYEDALANAKEAAAHFLTTQLRQDDEVGIIGFSPMRGFFIKEYLTTDHAKILMALKRSGELRPSKARFEHIGPANNKMPKELVSGENRGEAMGAEIGIESAIRRSSASYPAAVGKEWISVPGTSANQRKDFAPRLSDLADVMKRIPGNKSLVLFSGRDLGPAATVLGRSFANAGTPIYAVNTKNWITRGSVIKAKAKRISNEHSLQDLSLASGGKYFADIEDIQTIARDIQALSGNFYVLGYYVEESWDGKFHEIDVEVKEPGFRVLAQEGYFNPKPFAEMSEFDKELHLFSLIYSDKPAEGEALDLPVAILDVVREGGRNGIVLLELAVDPKTGVSPSQVELCALIKREGGRLLVSRKWDLNLSSYRGETLIMAFSTPLEPGPFDGRIVVRDVETGRSSVGRNTFEIEPPPEGAMIISSPVILVPGADSRIANLPSGGKRRERAAETNLLDLYPFIPRNHKIIVRDVDYGTEKILALLPVGRKASARGNKSRIGVSARLVLRASGEEIELAFEIIEGQRSKDGCEFLTLEIALPVLDRGDYELVIEVADRDSGESDPVKTGLVIK
jgi:VWFA-related protein